MGRVAKFIVAARVLAAAFIFSAGAAACAPAQLPGDSLVANATPVAEKERLDCVGKGGKIRPVCRSGRLMCIVAYADAGKSCTDNSDCTSNKCIAEGDGQIGQPASGKCKVANDPCGCTTTVKNGRRSATLCVD